MTREDFRTALEAAQPPAGLPAALEILWRDARGDWDGAHRVAQDQQGPEGAWLHAYLHRKEGDLSNAAYWYRRAERPVPTCSLEEEWETLARTFCGG